MVRGPQAGLAALAAAEADPAPAGDHRVDAVRAHLLELAGDRGAAREQFRLAARRTLSIPERRYLEVRAGPPGPARMGSAAQRSRISGGEARPGRDVENPPATPIFP
jgi:hypothetical protein